MARLRGTATARVRGRAHVRTQTDRKAVVIATLAQEQQGSPLGSLFLLLALAAAFYFVAIRPGRRRMQAMQAVQRTLAPGREVVTTAGLYATVSAVDEAEGTVTLQIAPGVDAKFARAAIMKVVDETVPEALPATGDDE